MKVGIWDKGESIKCAHNKHLKSSKKLWRRGEKKLKNISYQPWDTVEETPQRRHIEQYNSVLCHPNGNEQSYKFIVITQKPIIGNYLPCIDKAGIRGILRNARSAKPMKGCKNNHGVRSL